MVWWVVSAGQVEVQEEAPGATQRQDKGRAEGTQVMLVVEVRLPHRVAVGPTAQHVARLAKSMVIFISFRCSVVPVVVVVEVPMPAVVVVEGFSLPHLVSSISPARSLPTEGMGLPIPAGALMVLVEVEER